MTTVLIYVAVALTCWCAASAVVVALFAAIARGLTSSRSVSLPEHEEGPAVSNTAGPTNHP